MYVPINQTGTHTLLAHSTLFGGNSTTETITLTAKFTNISNDLIMNPENDFEIKSIIANSKNSEITSKSNNSALLISHNDALIISDNQSDLGFDIGLLLGITIGTAIGISIIFIIRQKNT